LNVDKRQPSLHLTCKELLTLSGTTDYGTKVPTYDYRHKSPDGSPTSSGIAQQNQNKQPTLNPTHTPWRRPQGTVLSPILYNLFVADIPTPRQTNVTLGQFADDTIYVASGRTIYVATQGMNNALKDLTT
ncbi:hypothetical protein ANN_26047, partial [Periplaneta americana]